MEKERFYLILILFIWGINFYFLQLGLSWLGPFQHAFFRVFLPALLFMPYLDKKEILRRDYLYLGFLMAFSIAVMNIGMKNTTLSNSSVISQSAGLFTVLLGAIRGSKVSFSRWTTLLISFFGTVLIITEGKLSYNPHIFGDFMILLFALSFSEYAVYGEKCGKDLKTLAANSYLIASPFLLLMALREPLPANFELFPFLAVLFSSLFANGWANYTWWEVLEKLSEYIPSLSMLGIPVITIIMDTLILGNSLPESFFLGALVFGIGFFLSLRYEKEGKKLPKRLIKAKLVN